MGRNNHRLTSKNLVNSMPERIFEVIKLNSAKARYE